MELFIRIVDGQPFEHPIFADNFAQAFPDVDVNNLPPEFARFERVDCPNNIGVYQTCNLSYQWVDGVVKDVWDTREMTASEKQGKITFVQEQWAQTGFASWVFDEPTCNFEAPIPMPTDDKQYRWDEPTTSWIEVTNV
jgi:hypothetical protein